MRSGCYEGNITYAAGLPYRAGRLLRQCRALKAAFRDGGTQQSQNKRKRQSQAVTILAATKGDRTAPWAGQGRRGAAPTRASKAPRRQLQPGQVQLTSCPSVAKAVVT